MKYYNGLKAALANVIRPTAQAAKEAERLGIQFNTAALRSQGLTGFLESITNAQGFTQASAEKLFGSIEGLNTIFALTGGQAGA